MFMSDDKKKQATLIVSKLSGNVEPKPMVDGAEQDASMGLDAAAEEILQAIESRDKSALKSALKSFMEMCEYEEPEAEEPAE